MKKVLILTDGKAGHENQSKAFAGALGYDFDLVEVHFKSKFHKALSYLLDHFGVRTRSLFDCKLNEEVSSYAAVIGTGSGTFYPAKVFAKKLQVPCGVVLYPRGYHIASFDCVLVPAFDRPKAAANVIELPANLVANDAAFYEKGVVAFREHAEAQGCVVSKGAVAVIVGGPNKSSTMTFKWMKSELDKIFASFENEAHWVTTSRRTPPEVEALVDSYPWDYKLIYSHDHFNPIPAFVSLAKRLYVTAESTGMLSEACTFGAAEVKVMDNLKTGPNKFRRFVDDLRKAGYVDGVRKIDLKPIYISARKLMNI